MIVSLSFPSVYKYSAHDLLVCKLQPMVKWSCLINVSNSFHEFSSFESVNLQPKNIFLSEMYLFTLTLQQQIKKKKSVATQVNGNIRNIYGFVMQTSLQMEV